MFKQLKILVVIPALGSNYGGPSKCVIELVESLANAGVTIDIVTTNANGSEELNVPLQTWVTHHNYRIQYFPYLKTGDYKFSFSLTRWLYKHVSDYDLVHTNALFSYPVLPAHWACQMRGVPYMMTPHGMLEPWALAYKADKKRLYFSFLEKPALERASAIQMLASSEAKSITQLNCKTPIYIIPNGIHHHDFVPLSNPAIFWNEFPQTRDRKLIIFLGRIDPKKGLDLLANAFKQVRHQFPDSHLIIAGPDNTGFLETVRGYFDEVGCLDAVTFTGMLTGAIKYAALAAADIYIAPSYSEGFSVSVLEGMASGLPCIITTGCNFPEAGEAEAAYIVDISPDSITDALIACLSNPQQSKLMGDRARKLILEEYTWNRIAANLIQVYQSILNQQQSCQHA
ncbi:glycosyltransferase [Calothrix sp. UHCC 0171]|uniref:glycosyltransferase n=1 Tax=Calothrix sp. UHCC 0171 TaxID=3110245 RepID=UPI002B1FD2E2|nr:glycosyltransferase [Calothrix sp. UHCC 0171]MEA5570396.1 glycosyltransferase [Calothrix sp. UHCC 0171]